MTESDWFLCAEPMAAYMFLRSETVTHKTRWQGWLTTRRFPISERKLRLFACACVGRVEKVFPVVEARDLLRAAEAFADRLIGDVDLENVVRACADRTIRQPEFRPTGAFAEAMIGSAFATAVPTSADQRLRHSQSSSRWLSFERDSVNAVLLVHRTEAFGRLESLTVANQAWTGSVVWRRYVDSLGGELRVRPGEFAPLEAAVQTCDRAFLIAERAAEAARQTELLRDIVGNPFRPASADPQWLAWQGGTVRRMARSIYDGRRFGDLHILADALEEAGCIDAEFLSHCRNGGPHVRGCWLLDQLMGKG